MAMGGACHRGRKTRRLFHARSSRILPRQICGYRDRHFCRCSCEISSPFPYHRNRAHQAEDRGDACESLRGGQQSLRRGCTEPGVQLGGRRQMTQRKRSAEAAEADALQRGIGEAARARSHEATSPPGLEHRSCSKAAAPGMRGETAQKVRQRAPSEKQDGNPQRDQAAYSKEREEKIFDHAITKNIELRAELRGKAASAREIAIDAIERNGSHS